MYYYVLSCGAYKPSRGATLASTPYLDYISVVRAVRAMVMAYKHKNGKTSGGSSIVISLFS
jgi:hypothetical protein